ncbi:hypothetical protein Tco_0246992 [Tanacetum coccineum]
MAGFRCRFHTYRPEPPYKRKLQDAYPLALRLLERMLAFEPKDRPISKEALSDPYSKNLAKVSPRGCSSFSAGAAIGLCGGCRSGGNKLL